MSINKKALFLFGVASTAFSFSHAKSDPVDYVDVVRHARIVAQHEGTTLSLRTQLQKQYFTDIELAGIIDTVLSSVVPQSSPESVAYLAAAQQSIINNLKQYKISGISFVLHPDFSLIGGSININLPVIYKTETGEIKNRAFTLAMGTFGVQAGISLVGSLVFFTDGGALNFYDTNKQLTLNTGIRIGLPIPVIPMDLTYAPFANATGGIVMLSLGIGLGGCALAIVSSGGTLTPVTE
jgi:hypothetical protein